MKKNKNPIQPVSGTKVTMEENGIIVRKKANDELSKIFYIGLKKKGKF